MKISRVFFMVALCFVLALGLGGCGGGGSTSSSLPSSNTTASSSNNTSGGASDSPTYASYGTVIFASDPIDNGVTPVTNNHSSILQVVHLFDPNGNPFSTPKLSIWSYDGVSDVDGAALTPDGSLGTFMDGPNTTLYFFSLTNGAYSQAQITPFDINGSNFGTDGDSVAVLGSGKVAVVSLDSAPGQDNLVAVSGIGTTNLQTFELDVPRSRDGVVISKDDKVLLARGYSGLTVFAINSTAPVSQMFTLTEDFQGYPLGSYNEDGEGRNGMAISPTDSSRAVVITGSQFTNLSQSVINLLTGLPGNPVLSNSVSVDQPVNSVTISGDQAIVGTEKGLLLFKGVSTGSLTLVGSNDPSYTLNNTSVVLGIVTTLGITHDGKNNQYVVAGDLSNGALLLIPISTSGFGAPASALPGVSVPWSDTMLIH